MMLSEIVAKANGQIKEIFEIRHFRGAAFIGHYDGPSSGSTGSREMYTYLKNNPIVLGKWSNTWITRILANKQPNTKFTQEQLESLQSILDIQGEDIDQTNVYYLKFFKLAFDDSAKLTNTIEEQIVILLSLIDDKGLLILYDGTVKKSVTSKIWKPKELWL